MAVQIYDIFLSYSSEDRLQVATLATDLRHAGLAVWLDEWQIKVGDSITQQIERGLIGSRYVAIWLSRASVASGWVQREWRSRFNEEIHGAKVVILPLMAEDCDLPVMLADKKFADFRYDYRVGLTALLSVFDKQLKTTGRKERRDMEVNDPITQSIESFAYVDPVDSAAKHGAMWRWNQRMFRSRHPRQYKQFDLVGLELGKSWWVKYPEQDWVLRDWCHEQIGHYCLCPISESTFSALLNGRIRETDLTPADIIDVNAGQGHSFWYMASFIRAKVIAGVVSEVADYCSNVMVEHMLWRALQCNHFATHYGHEISIVAVVEAKSLEKLAEKNRFTRSILSASNSVEEKVYQSLWTRKQIEFAFRRTKAALSDVRELVEGYRAGGKSVFQQPPNYK
ncbi:MAG: toll/interleukin-1 receptor domain-containing protein [Chthoniobacter sp.]|nr:toll/interleukin-1 receptor domain-containing protein [Chthoniobacter sp.]